MGTVLGLSLVAVCALLTIVLLACLRGIAELRLQLSGVAAEAQRDRLLAGRELPAVLRARLPWGREDGLVVFLSSDCPVCGELPELLARVRIGNIVAGLLHPDVELRERLLEHVGVLDEEAVRASAEELEVDATPMLIHQRDGVIVGTAYGEAATSVDELERFWTAGGARLLEVAR